MIYVDNAATTKLDPLALEEMLPFLREQYGNPSAVYSLGSEAKKAVALGRRRVAEVIGAAPEEIVFTSGGSESDNWALFSAARAGEKKGRHVITTKIEHHAVLNACAELERQGFSVTYLDVDGAGRVSAKAVEKAIRPDTILVSVMFANNEVGTIQPIAEIGRICRERGVLFHVDAVQAFGHLPIDVQEMNVDLLSASAHKLHGPKGIGLLYVRKGLRPEPLIYGGTQERSRRAGTENVAGIVGFGRAAELSRERMEAATARMLELSGRLKERIKAQIPDVRINGEGAECLPGHVSVCIPPVEGESVLIQLDLQGICASSGSACTIGSSEPSHVLLAMGRTPEEAKGSLRFTLSEENTMEEVDEIAEALKKIVGNVRKMMGYRPSGHLIEEGKEKKPETIFFENKMRERTSSKGKVVVGMSGGVDSSVAAMLLKQQGYDVIGVTMQIWQDENFCRVEEHGGCCGASAVEDARRVAQVLEIPYYVMNFKDVFQEQVICPFVEEYLRGRTPNPCILCNRKVKWEALLQRSLELGADFVATGHYARIETLPNGRLAIRNSVTAGKDQTYALYNLTQEQLAHTLMPVGEYEKSQVRKMAREAGLPVADKPDSQEICFVPGDDYAGFIDGVAKNRVPGSGNFVTKEGEILGKHKGITHYTIGQRRGLELPMGHRVFVTEIRPDANEVVIGENEDLFVDRLVCGDLNFMAIDDLREPRRVKAKIRYNHGGEYCTIEKIGEDLVECRFEAKVRAATPGQAVVFYEDDHVLGGGTIL